MEIALGTPEWYSEVMYVEWKLVLVRIEIVSVTAKDRCPVCAKCPRAWKSLWAHPNGTPRYRMSSGSLFRSILRLCKSSSKIGAQSAPNVPRA